MEKTFFHRFRMTQALQTYVGIEFLPDALHALIPLYEEAFGTRLRGTLSEDVLSFDKSFNLLDEPKTWDASQLTLLSPEYFHLLKTWIQNNDHTCQGLPISSSAFFRTAIVRFGQKFEISDISATNSRVLYRRGRRIDSEAPLDWDAAVIGQIFSHTRERGIYGGKTQTFVVVTPYESLPEALLIDHKDPYRQFPIIANRLFCERLTNDIAIVPLEDVVCHFAYTPISLAEDFPINCMQAHPLDKVSQFLETTTIPRQ